MKHLISFLIFTIVFSAKVQYTQNANHAPDIMFEANNYYELPFNIEDFNGNWIFIANYNSSLNGVLQCYWSDSDKVWCGGGFPDTGLTTFINEDYFYNPNTDTYRQLPPIPNGAAYGKAVRCKNKIYLVGTVSTWASPDGMIYQFDPAYGVGGRWAIMNKMPSPYVTEPAVCTWHDSLIIVIGGATNGWIGAVKTIQIYNPSTNSWQTSPSTFPISVMSGDAECIGNEIMECGAYGTMQTLMYRGTIIPTNPLTINWRSAGNNLYGHAVFRTSGGVWGNYWLFGSTDSYGPMISKVFGIKSTDSSIVMFNPPAPLITERQTISVRTKGDSIMFYYFCGMDGSGASNLCNRYMLNPIGIIKISTEIPKTFSLYQNYPNPFNPTTVIRFQVSSYRLVKIKIYNILGMELTTLVNEKLQPGIYKVNWNAVTYSSGVYFYKIVTSDPFGKAENFTETKRMVLIK